MTPHETILGLSGRTILVWALPGRATMSNRPLALLFAVGALACCGGSQPQPQQQLPDMTLRDPDSIVVDPPACVDHWLVTHVPRAGNLTSYAFGPDDKWQLAYLGARSPNDPITVRHVSESTITEADSLPVGGAPSLTIAPDNTVAVAVLPAQGKISVFRLGGGGWVQLGDKLGGSHFSQGFTQTHLASDSKGSLDLAWETDHPYVATYGGTAWATTPVGPQVLLSIASFVVDGSDHQHLFFSGNDPNLPTYNGFWATNASGAWVVTPMPAKLTTLSFGIVDRAGRPHVMAYDTALHHLVYDGGAWNEQSLPPDMQIAAAAFDASNHVHLLGQPSIASSPTPTGDVLYATDASGTWVTSTIARFGSGVRVGNAAVAFDHGGQPRFAFDSALGTDFAHHHFAQPCP
jgi:hypothetical protein